MTPEFLLRFGISLVMVVFGIHQMIKPQKWFDYIPDFVKKISPISSSTEMRLHALGNIAFGLLLFSNTIPNTAGWITLVWWLTILPFAIRKNWAIALRDFTIICAVGAYILLVA